MEAADANIQSSEEAYRDTLITLYSEVALNYIEVRTHYNDKRTVIRRVRGED